MHSYNEFITEELTPFSVTQAEIKASTVRSSLGIFHIVFKGKGLQGMCIKDP